MTYVLVSACLMGACCRYDGASNRNEQVLDLLKREDICLIPVCPEQMGGLTTPRVPSERRDGGVFNRAGEDVTGNYRRGAEQALKAAELYHCPAAVLKERSPSCGSGKIYDGTFSHRLTDGDGTTAELLRKNGIKVFGESRIDQLVLYLDQIQKGN